MSVPAGETFARVTRVVKTQAGAEVKEVRCSPNLVSILNVMTGPSGLGGGYAEAVEFVRKADRAEALGGKGCGGRPDTAQAGGRDGAKADAAVKAVEGALSK